MDREAKVLIVDDKQNNRYSIDRILSSLEVSLHHACSGAEALQRVLDHDFAIILMDAVMPDIDGYETARLIHGNKHYKHIPIVMVTAHDNTKEQYIKAYEAGAIDFIIKPIEPIVLLNKVKQFIDLYWLRHTAQLSQVEQQQVASRMQALLNSAGEGILGIDLTGKISFANPKACELLQIDHSQLLSSQLQDFWDDNTLHTGDSSRTDCVNNNEERLSFDAIINDDGDFKTHTQRWVSASGGSFFVEFSCEITKDKDGKNNGGVVMFQNISERKATEEKLVYLANFDPLTNLANRAYFYDSLARAIARSKRSKSTLALLFLDLDHFKNINDSLGHDAGDHVLHEAGCKIVASIRTGDLAARVGGDEFAIILHDINSAAATINIAEKIIANIAQPIELKNNKIVVNTSIGIAIYDEYGMSMDELVNAADSAMYAAKKDGRNNYKFFDPKMQEQAEEKNKIHFALSEALANHEFSVYYQPKVCISLNKIVGFEALLRWTDKNGKSISPDIFIPIAEESGMIHNLGKWVFIQVCQQIEQWCSLPEFNDLVISVNVSAHQLQTGNFHQLVKEVLKQYNFDPAHLEFELTETAVMSDPSISARQLQNIKDIGIHISIDDFGTGYSSLNYLKRFPIDALKIDRCFIKDIGEDKHDEEIIKIMVAIAKTMGIDVIAEGIETEQQLAFLSSVGCDLGQGYYFSKAVDSNKTTQMIKNIGTCHEPHVDEICAGMTEQPLMSNIIKYKLSNKPI
ncbi:MAG: EAL domain-containing protein [Pseudomonadales bacterium]